MHTGYKVVFGGMAVLIAAMTGHAVYTSSQREEERRQALIKVRQERATPSTSVPTATPVPSPALAAPTKAGELPRLTVAGGTLKTGMSWDDALPTLEKGERLKLERTDADSFVDVRSFDGHVYRLSFWRNDGPYRLLTIIEQ